MGIADILDRADALRANRASSLSYLADLEASLFVEHFGSSTAESVLLGDIVESALIGLVRSASQLGGGLPFPYMRMDSINRSGALDRSKFTTTRASEVERARYQAIEGDLMFNTRNSRELVGKSAIFRGEPALFNNNLMRLRFDRNVHPAFVHAFLCTVEGRRQLEQRKSGTTSVSAIYAKDLMSTRIPLPSSNAQVRFADQLAKVDAYRSRVLVAKQRYDELFTSLQQRAFVGEL